MEVNCVGNPLLVAESLHFDRFEPTVDAFRMIPLMRMPPKCLLMVLAAALTSSSLHSMGDETGSSKAVLS